MPETLGKIYIDDGEIILTYHDGTEELWKETKTPSYEVGTQFINFRGSRYFLDEEEKS